MKVLLKFTHGLGDAVQFGCVLKHLQKYRPEWIVDVAILVGKHSAIQGLCDRVLVIGRDEIDESLYDQVVHVYWYENYSGVPGSPQTKVCNCLREEFGIEPDLSLLGYSVETSDTARARTADYLRAISGPPDERGEFPVVALHYEGNTSADRKNLTHETARRVCEAVIEHGYVPLILDWDRRSPIPDQQTVFCPQVYAGDLWGSTGTGDAGTLAALIGQCAMMIGVDSGPLHVAGATETPTLGVWTEHHPLQFYDLCQNVVHLVRPDWTERISGAGQREFFEERYKFDVYQSADPGRAIENCVRHGLPHREHDAPKIDHRTLIRGHDPIHVRLENAEQDSVIVEDVYVKDAYHLCSLDQDELRRVRLVIDVGAHIGCFAVRAHEMCPDARIVCVECCLENWHALDYNVGRFAECVGAACTYETGPLVLLNAYFPNCRSTGGSTVSRIGSGDQQYRVRPLCCERVTLEDLSGGETIDLLKLDCEGSEFSILEKATCLDRIRCIVGEYHGAARWQDLVRRRFQGWEYTQVSESGDLGNFCLRNASLKPPVHAGDGTI